MCKTCRRKRSCGRRGERDKVICISNRCIGTRLMNMGRMVSRYVQVTRRKKGHQTEPFLAVFVDIDGQSLQKYDTSPILQLGQQGVQDVDMRLRVYFLLDSLVESDDGVSYCTLKCQREARNGTKTDNGREDRYELRQPRPALG